LNIYLESTAFLAWLLGEPAGDAVHEVLVNAQQIAASELTAVECERALQRGAVLGSLDEADAAELRGAIHEAERHWLVQRLDAEVLTRARAMFPDEPVRTLDALHLSSALRLATALQDLTMVSLDDRVRRNAALLGFGVLPN
jgi:predicted nucleic acid-binding protein